VLVIGTPFIATEGEGKEVDGAIGSPSLLSSLVS